MKIVPGRAVVNGVAIGSLRVCRRRRVRLRESSELSAGAERARFDRARQTACEQLDGLYQSVCARTGEGVAAIFEIHQMMLEDEDYLSAVQNCLDRGNTAQYAVSKTGEMFARTIDALADSYMRARSSDVRDVTRRMVRLLMDLPEDGLLDDGPAILAMDELSPSEAAGLDCGRLLGIITRYGSCYSHTAILARALQIPSIVNTVFEDSWDGKIAVLDGYRGVVYVDPTPELLAGLEEAR